MNLMTLLFGFNGRIRRLHWWLAALGVTMAASLAAMAVLIAGAASDNGNPILLLLLAMIMACVVWISVALGVKRCHDRDRSGLFVLVGLIPLVGGLWLLVDLGLLEGTPGPNRFGPPTLPPPSTAALAA